MSLAGLNLTIDHCDRSTPMSSESCSVLSGTSNEDWEIDDTTKDVWDWDTTLTVVVDDSVSGNNITLGSGEFSARWLMGVVQIDNYTSGSGTTSNITAVRVSGNYLNRDTVLEGRDSSYAIEPNLLDATRFGDAGIRRIRGTVDLSPSFEQLQMPETPIDGSGGSGSTPEGLMQNGTDFVFAYDPGASGTKDKMRTVVTFGSVELEGPVDDLQAKSWEMESDVQSSTMSDQPDADFDTWNY